MKVYLLMTRTIKAIYHGSPEVRAVYLDSKTAYKEAKRLNESPYTRGDFWIETKTVKENT